MNPIHLPNSKKCLLSLNNLCIHFIINIFIPLYIFSLDLRSIFYTSKYKNPLPLIYPLIYYVFFSPIYIPQYECTWYGISPSVKSPWQLTSFLAAPIHLEYCYSSYSHGFSFSCNVTFSPMSLRHLIKLMKQSILDLWLANQSMLTNMSYEPNGNKFNFVCVEMPFISIKKDLNTFSTHLLVHVAICTNH